MLVFPRCQFLYWALFLFQHAPQHLDQIQPRQLLARIPNAMIVPQLRERLIELLSTYALEVDAHVRHTR